MPITSTLEITVEFKITDIEISIVKRTILLKIKKSLMNGASIMSSSNFNVLIQGDDFDTMSNHIPNGTKNLYDEIGTVAYTYCVTNNKLV